jgi:23S rRNA (pseudouridine1915-N3)-methyltransferase
MSKRIHILSLLSSPLSDKNDEICRDYVKRLPSSIQVTYPVLKTKTLTAVQEYELVIKKISEWKQASSLYIILLDEHGRSYTSQAFSTFLFQKWETYSTILFVIGSAYGHHPMLKEKANELLSLSSMTFPHKMTRLLITEQIYRAWTIQTGHPYHHD